MPSYPTVRRYMVRHGLVPQPEPTPPALQEEYRKRGMKVANALQTNGTLLDDEWCHFLKEHKCLVGLSLDGPRKLHDAYRVDKGGKPTFESVHRALNLLQRHGVDFNILCVVNRVNGDHPLKVYRFFKSEGGADRLTPPR